MMDLPFRQTLNNLGVGLRAMYMDVLAEREPTHLQPLISRLLRRDVAESKRGSGRPPVFTGR